MSFLNQVCVFSTWETNIVVNQQYISGFQTELLKLHMSKIKYRLILIEICANHVLTKSSIYGTTCTVQEKKWATCQNFSSNKVNLKF